MRHCEPSVVSCEPNTSPYRLAKLGPGFVPAEFHAGSNHHLFNSAGQLRITVGGGAVASPIRVPIRNRWPSGVTSNS